MSTWRWDLVTWAGLAACAVAAPITTPDSMSGVTALMNFESFPTGPIASPLTVQNATFSGMGSSLGVVSVTGYDADGTEVHNKTLQPVASDHFAGGSYTPITITFAVPVREVILGWFDPNFNQNFLVAIDANGHILEQAAVALGPPGGGHAAWIGFKRDASDIARVIVMSDPSNVDVYSIDNVRYFIGASCPADLDGDLVVTFRDLNILLGVFNTFGAPSAPGDVDDDGDCDFADLNALIAVFNTNC